MMTGMLVPVEELYEPVDKAMSAVATLFGVDPEFVTLCKTLYGPDVDPVEVWSDVFKMNPTGSDSHVPGTLETKSGRKRALEAAGIGATVIGAALGAEEIRGSARELRAARRAGKPGGLWPKAKLAGVGAMLGGDAAATGNQVGAAREKRRTAPVAKIGVGALANGFEAGMRKLPGMGGLAPKVKTVGQSTQRTMLGSPKRATATAGSALVGGATAGRMNKREDDLDVIWAGEFSKFDEDKRLVFGWASVCEVNGQPVVDKQGDYIHPDVLENASYEYVIKSRVGGDMHSRNGSVPFKVSDLVESMVFTPEKVSKMGLPPYIAEKIPTGWWVGFKVHSDEHWEMVKKQARTGFSIHGRGKRIPTTMDELVPGYH